MSHIDTSVTNTEVIPVFETDLFDGHEESRFAIGIIALGDEITPGCEAEFGAYLRLRAKVYADQTNMIGKDQVREDGTETDVDDSRSIHFGLFEQHAIGARAVGAIRIIMKTEEDDRPLPIEDFFPDTFADGKAPVGAVEASRYIARHESAAIQETLSTPLFSGVLAFVSAHNLGPLYGVVEPKVEKSLTSKGVPLERVAEPVFVPEYNADNLGILVDSDEHVRRIFGREPGVRAPAAPTEPAEATKQVVGVAA
jgi:N-acyl-L-homoserine lactone synthetase